ncbi:hypothetical protein [Quadrisphaera sp. INWT6]|nr:hypothetical protein [Quadrisphaera sp. INWT6]
MDLLPVVLLLLAAFVLFRLVQLAVDPSAREHGAPVAAAPAPADTTRRAA